MRQQPRAYLLLEAAMGGAMVAVIVGSILTSLSQARTLSIVMGRDQTASQLVVEKLEERRALGFALVTAQTAAVVPDVVGKYTRTTTVATCTETIPAPGINLNCKDITVTVSYTTSNNAKLGASTTRVSQAVARVYE
ncbi:MAG: hypothetical protein Q8O67_30210 [Deltaproteobacteria bacterium]|nr:hypothetical protein [Deltaproteobacteria bacterium]